MRGWEAPVAQAGTPTLTVEAVESSRVIVGFNDLLESVPAGFGAIATYPVTD